MKTLLAIIWLILCSAVHAGSMALIAVEAPMFPQGAKQEAAKDYLKRYPDVAAVYQNRPEGAVEHWINYGQFEGWRVWNGYLDIAIITYCGDTAAISGYNCVHFPAGAKIGAISWESSVKVLNSEVFSYLQSSSGVSLMTTYQQGQGVRVKTITLPEPIILPPGSFVWLYAQGWGDYNAGGFEAQISLYLMD